jgi:hypothetical protein
MEEEFQTDELVPMLSKFTDTYVKSKKNWKKDFKKK